MVIFWILIPSFMLSVIFFKQNGAGSGCEQKGCEKENGKNDF